MKHNQLWIFPLSGRIVMSCSRRAASTSSHSLGLRIFILARSQIGCRPFRAFAALDLSLLRLGWVESTRVMPRLSPPMLYEIFSQVGSCQPELHSTRIKNLTQVTKMSIPICFVLSVIHVAIFLFERTIVDDSATAAAAWLEKTMQAQIRPPVTRKYHLLALHWQLRWWGDTYRVDYIHSFARFPSPSFSFNRIYYSLLTQLQINANAKRKLALGCKLRCLWNKTLRVRGKSHAMYSSCYAIKMGELLHFGGNT